MRCSVLLAMLTSFVASARARADIMPPPQRPDWDTPVPMPPEIAWLTVGVLVLLSVMVGRALAERGR